ncbi:MAG: hypothetical protein U0235_03645 [Polyangiaceae bacterium]
MPPSPRPPEVSESPRPLPPVRPPPRASVTNEALLDRRPDARELPSPLAASPPPPVAAPVTVAAAPPTIVAAPPTMAAAPPAPAAPPARAIQGDVLAGARAAFLARDRASLEARVGRSR